MAATVTLRFERGTIVIDGAWADQLPGVLWDPRSSSRRAAAHRFGALVAEASLRGNGIGGDLRAGWGCASRSTRDLGLRPYQSHALAAWAAFDRRGVIVLPTGAGKTRVPARLSRRDDGRRAAQQHEVATRRDGDQFNQQAPSPQAIEAARGMASGVAAVAAGDRPTRGGMVRQ